MITDILEVDYLDFFRDLSDDYIRYIEDLGEDLNEYIYEYIKNYGEEVYDRYAPDYNINLQKVYHEFIEDFKTEFPEAEKELSFLKDRLGLKESLKESLAEEDLTADHLSYVLHNVLDWKRDYTPEDLTDVEAVAKACHKYDDNYDVDEYEYAINSFDFLNDEGEVISSPADEYEEKDQDRIIGTWKDILEGLENLGYYIPYSYYKEDPEQWISIIKDGMEYEAGVTKYSDGKYELMLHNICEVGPLNEALVNFKDWLPEDVDLYKNIDWRARGYKSYPVPGTEYIGRCYLYGEKGKKGVDEPFVKYINSNPIFPPYYAPVDNTSGKEYTSAMYDGREKDGYKIHDRRETWELYRLLSDSSKTSRKNRLTEGTWSIPDTKEKAQAILDLMQEPISSKEAPKAMYDLYGDDKLFDSFFGNSKDVRFEIRQGIRKLVNDIEEYPDTWHRGNQPIIWDPEVVDVLKKVANYKLTESTKMKERLNGVLIDELIDEYLETKLSYEEIWEDVAYNYDDDLADCVVNELMKIEGAY